MGALSDAIGFGGKEMASAPPAIAEDIDELDAAVEPSTGGSAEVLAMKQFQRATTPEAAASAMKDFLEACGAIGSDY